MQMEEIGNAFAPSSLKAICLKVSVTINDIAELWGCSVKEQLISIKAKIS